MFEAHYCCTVRRATLHNFQMGMAVVAAGEIPAVHHLLQGKIVNLSIKVRKNCINSVSLPCIWFTLPIYTRLLCSKPFYGLINIFHCEVEGQFAEVNFSS